MIDKLESQKQDAISIIVASTVLLNDWLPTLKDLYRQTVNPLTKLGKPKTTPFENKLNTFESSCNNFLKYLQWDYGDIGATKEYEAVAQLGELMLQIQKLPNDRRLEIDRLVEKYSNENTSK